MHVKKGSERMALFPEITSMKLLEAITVHPYGANMNNFLFNRRGSLSKYRDDDKLAMKPHHSVYLIS